jgi:hypothetical protein
LCFYGLFFVFLRTKLEIYGPPEDLRTAFYGLRFACVEIRPIMYVAMTDDHRVIDGREAVRLWST